VLIREKTFSWRQTKHSQGNASIYRHWSREVAYHEDFGDGVLDTAKRWCVAEPFEAQI